MTDHILLGFDFGLKKMGVAVGQTITKTAQPLTILPAKQGIPDWSVINTLIQEWGVTALVVGDPLTISGDEQPLSQQAKKFARRLEAQTGLPVHLIDERYTTRVARLEDQHTHSVDAMAAMIILEAWLKQEGPAT